MNTIPPQDGLVALELPFGHSRISLELPRSNLLSVLLPRDGASAPEEGALLRQALAQPIGTPRLRDLARPEQRVVIVTSDLTRPCPSDRLLPPLLQELAAAGVPDANILIVVALGLHRSMSESELETTVGSDVYRRVRVVNHDPENTVRLGSTSFGTPVEIFRPVVEADLRVCVGNLELHYFVGYSGGAKAVLPGCASRATVTANHAMMARPEAASGRLEGNPVRADIEEGVAMLGVDFILNVTVDGEKRILGAVAGEVSAAHRRGCELIAQRAKVSIPERADIVVVSAGGYPKDVNLYQAQKALENARHAARKGGIIVWVAACGEGYGNPTFETWMREMGSPDELLDRIQREFVLGGHKAAAIASVLKRNRVYLVSALPEGAVRWHNLVSFDDLSNAMQAAFGEIGRDARVIVMPHGGSILPTLMG
jgi:nickel-dependent lactate racemase